MEIAIVGAGFSGTLVAAQLLRKAARHGATHRTHPQPIRGGERYQMKGIRAARFIFTELRVAGRDCVLLTRENLMDTE